MSFAKRTMTQSKDPRMFLSSTDASRNSHGGLNWLCGHSGAMRRPLTHSGECLFTLASLHATTGSLDSACPFGSQWTGFAQDGSEGRQVRSNLNSYNPRAFCTSLGSSTGRDRNAARANARYSSLASGILRSTRRCLRTVSASPRMIGPLNAPAGPNRA